MAKSKRAATKNNPQNEYQRLLVTGLIALIILVFMIAFWIKHGTYSLEDGPTLAISCPEEANPGNTVICHVALNNPNGVVIMSVNANYDLAEVLVYNYFSLNDECEGETCFEEYANTENGFAIANLTGVTISEEFGELALTIPETVAPGNAYQVGLKNIELSNSEFEMIELNNVSTNIMVVEPNGGGEEEPPQYTEDTIIPRVTNGITYGALKTTLNLDDDVTLVSHNAVEITDESIVRTGDQIELSNGVTLTISVLGDINGDGVVRVSDVGKLFRHVRKKDIITEEYILSAGDINRNSAISVADVELIYRYVRKKINTLEVVE